MSGYRSTDSENEEIAREIVVIEGDIVDSDSESSYDSQQSWRSGYVPESNAELERIQENIERIYNLEADFLDSDKQNHKYYLGLCTELGGSRLLLNIAIQPQTFLRFDIKSVLNYLAEYSIFTFYREILDVSSIQLQIMELDIEPRTCWQTVRLKTCWIRIVQRVWKRVFRERQEVMMKRRTLQNIRYFERHGKHLPGLHVLPSIHGMLRL
jgi:hypothetical protein